FSNIYPVMVVQMVEVGETTGSLSDTLRNLAKFYEEEVSNITKNLSSIIEPALMIIVGIAVGFFAISIIQPIYSLVGQM
ncbi:secretion system protein, partial [Candidatus Falkowbacteria bacterium CG23_combo_of_CG06-09_8_20_14_all_41_10]